MAVYTRFVLETQDDEVSNSDHDDDTHPVKSNEGLGTEDSQDDESSSEDDPDWGCLEDSTATEEIDGDDDECSSSTDDKDDSRNTLRCVQYFTLSTQFFLIDNTQLINLYEDNISF